MKQLNWLTRTVKVVDINGSSNPKLTNTSFHYYSVFNKKKKGKIEDRYLKSRTGEERGFCQFGELGFVIVSAKLKFRVIKKVIE